MPKPARDKTAFVLSVNPNIPAQRVSELAVQSQNATETDETRGVVVTELRSILDTATDGVLVLDRAGRLLSANKSADRTRISRPLSRAI